MDRKLLTAEKILGNADDLLEVVFKSKKLEIIQDSKMRNESTPFDWCKLRRKYFL